MLLKLRNNEWRGSRETAMTAVPTAMEPHDPDWKSRVMDRTEDTRDVGSEFIEGHRTPTVSIGSVIMDNTDFAVGDAVPLQ